MLIKRIIEETMFTLMYATIMVSIFGTMGLPVILFHHFYGLTDMTYGRIIEIVPVHMYECDVFVALDNGIIKDTKSCDQLASALWVDRVLVGFNHYYPNLRSPQILYAPLQWTYHHNNMYMCVVVATTITMILIAYSIEKIWSRFNKKKAHS